VAEKEWHRNRRKAAEMQQNTLNLTKITYFYRIPKISGNVHFFTEDGQFHGNWHGHEIVK